MSGATAFVSRIVEAGIVPATLEFIDRLTIDAIELWGVAHYPPGAGAVLLLELDGERDVVAAGLERVRAIAHEMGAMEVTATDDPAERDGLWLGRRSAFAAVGRFARRAQTQDITVPRERLTEMLEATEEIATRFGLVVATIGHAGDGNLHPDFLYNDGEENIEERIHEANTEVFRACVAMGGSISGEHGIGSDKLHGMPIMFGPTELGIMADVKRALDPAGILNPGKAIVPAPRFPAMRVTDDEVAAAIQEDVLRAIESGDSPDIDLSVCTGIAVDPGNLTVQVGAGETWDAVEAALADGALHFPLAPLRERSVYRSLLLNDYGPEHLASGTLRQHLLAVTFVTGRGEVVTMGRAVVKNVAGYDLFRLLIGSRGRYGIPIRCTLRLAPRSQAAWVYREWPPDDDLRIPAGAEAAFADWDGAGGRVYYRIAGRIPPGWEASPDADRLLATRRADIAQADDVLDLHLERSAASRMSLPELFGLLPQPICVLPHAARVLVRADRDSAVRLVDEARARGAALRRADWGRGWEPLIPLDEPARRWDGLLTNDIFSGSMLGDWFEREIRAR
jgi:FAD/FMN-containing dehydrogenase